MFSCWLTLSKQGAGMGISGFEKGGGGGVVTRNPGVGVDI